jgi:leucyl-tRNA synthetase
MMIFVNALQKAPAVQRSTVLRFLQILAPFAPHVGEELWSRMGENPSIQNASWPSFDASKLVASEVKLVFQVNGKHRGDALVPVGLPQPEAVALASAHERVSPFISGKALKRVIYVPGKILNLVVEG